MIQPSRKAGSVLLENFATVVPVLLDRIFVALYRVGNSLAKRKVLLRFERWRSQKS